ncbi:MAG TPA: beta galactosidase jelly roll domain-containing protein, partial [Bacteroidales bacterium]|nr:beta galactosidase jelly roll domain-containing protein [Bacteroidales bacterium]
MLRSLLLLSTVLLVLPGCNSVNTRHEISLNGRWSIARTGTDQKEIPAEFLSSIPVPGLVDMATPAISQQDTAYHHSLFWYRTQFAPVPGKYSLVRLKINKAKYHTRVFVNGHFAGENTRSFTPTVVDLKPYLSSHGEKNELVISVGCRDQLPDTVVNGHDFEKTTYLPGIYDDVALVMGNYPFIEGVQTVPDPENERIRVVATILMPGNETSASARWQIRELASDSIVSNGETTLKSAGSNQRAELDFTAPVPGCRVWTPEDPFLYKLELFTSADHKTTRFGMRTFSFDRDKGMAILNGKPYFMRGTNVCIFRFFEDPARRNLPWDSTWPVTLHQRFKELNWNSIRYCIGFPPERWYDI